MSENKETETPPYHNKRYIPDESARAFAFTEWLGALARWVINFGSKKFNDLYEPKYRKRNFIIGYGLTILFVIALMATLIFLSN